MDSYALLIIARVIHIAGGVFWVGSAIFLALFLFPTVREMGPDGSKVAQSLMQRRKLSVYMNVAAGLAMLSGFWLYGRMIATTPGWGGSRQGMIFGVGGVCAVLAAIVGNALNSRSAKKMAVIGASIQANGGPPTAEQGQRIAQLQQRLALGLKLVTVFLIIAVLAMSVARYM